MGQSKNSGRVTCSNNEALFTLPAEESLALITKPHALLLALWDEAPFTCDVLLKVNFKLHHLLQVIWRQWHKNVSLRWIKYIILLGHVFCREKTTSLWLK